MDQIQEEKKNKMFYFTIILLVLFVGYMVAKESGYITETNKSIEKSKIEVQIGIKKIGNVSRDLSGYNASTNITINKTININISK